MARLIPPCSCVNILLQLMWVCKCVLFLLSLAFLTPGFCLGVANVTFSIANCEKVSITPSCLKLINHPQYTVACHNVHMLSQLH